MTAMEARRALVDLCLPSYVSAMYWIVTGRELPPTNDADPEVVVGTVRAQHLLRHLSKEDLQEVLGCPPAQFSEIWTALKGER